MDPTGKPVGRARLKAPDAWIMSQLARKDGSFELRVSPGKISLWAEHDGHAPSEMQELSLAPGEEPAEVVLRLGWLAHLSGEVVDPGGRPVAGREVAFTLPPADGVWSRHQDMAPVETDANGRFSAEVLPGRIEVFVELSDEELQALGRPPLKSGASRPSCVRAVTLAPGETGYVRLAMGGLPVRLHGRIEVGGKAPSDVDLRTHGYAGTGWQSASYAAGEYEVVLPEPGAYTLVLSADGANFQPSVDVPASAEFRFDVSIPIGRLSGQVRSEVGSALEGIVVDAHIQGEGQPFRSSGRATTDRSGAYSMELLPGTYRVGPREDFEEQRSFREPEPQLARVDPDADRGGVDFVLQTIGALDGIVRRSDGGVLEGASVHVTGCAPDSERREPAQDRTFHIPLESGTYWVSAVGGAGPAGFASAEPLVVELAPGEVQRLELRVVPHTLVRVRLLDADGNALVTRLEAIDESGRAGTFDQLEPGVGSLLLRPGSYTLRVLRERMVVRPLDVPDGQTALDLEWRVE